MEPRCHHHPRNEESRRRPPPSPAPAAPPDRLAVDEGSVAAAQITQRHAIAIQPDLAVTARYGSPPGCAHDVTPEHERTLRDHPGCALRRPAPRRDLKQLRLLSNRFRMRPPDRGARRLLRHRGGHAEQGQGARRYNPGLSVRPGAPSGAPLRANSRNGRGEWPTGKFSRTRPARRQPPGRFSSI